jgi:hypothetical protein
MYGLFQTSMVAVRQAICLKLPHAVQARSESLGYFGKNHATACLCAASASRTSIIIAASIPGVGRRCSTCLFACRVDMTEDQAAIGVAHLNLRIATILASTIADP